MMRRIIPRRAALSAVALLLLWAGCSALASVVVPVPVWKWSAFIPVSLWRSYAPYALAPVCDFTGEHNLNRNDALLASVPLPEGSRVIASYAHHPYGGAAGWWPDWPGGRRWATGGTYRTSAYYIRLPPGLAPAEALQWYADNLPVVNADWQSARATTPSLPGDYRGHPDEYWRMLREAAPWPQPAAAWQFSVFRNGKAGLSIEHGRHGANRSIVRMGDDQRAVPFHSVPSQPPDTRERLPDPQRDIIIAVNFLAYDPPGAIFCPKLGY